MAQQGQPQTVAPVEPCWSYPGYQAYLARIDPAAQPYRNVVDHFWSNFLRQYFATWEDCEHERYPCTTHPRPRQHWNVYLTNIRDQQAHHVIAVEARWFPSDTSPGWENNYDWTNVRETLRAHMLSDWTMRTTVQTTYGIVAVGDRVRFYYMSKNDLEGRLRTWNDHPVDAPGADHSPILNIHSLVDQGVIHQLMLRMRQDVLSGCNTY
ncbi:hypothetical protein AtubIFM56815_004137 [Aspergillus tubingensis]|uniref:Uncharacterized protein n=1 Tax=Aspergillus tubingensis TaxID=5068 RepID=A0A8H3T4X7_ASPTU|nr:RTA1 like family protein [Aspergillus tubingensis]GFN21564.1 RTA1 like family protein [Aspergillus tubingensis]GLA63801.1 hypothetical protein AtubIFM54640_004957 [Aspergillus tubingensis]GLA89649.1 hypothetical protein AtubIFM56815_004137 [Aspergillus tubingensis]